MASNKSSTAIPYTPSFGGFTNQKHLAATELSEAEFATRSPMLAESLSALLNIPEVATAIEITEEYTLGSSSGDEIGFGVELDKAYAKLAAPRSQDRLLKACRYALSGLDVDLLGTVVFRMLAWGDAFALYDVDEQDRLAITLRPTWQVFLEPDIYTGQAVAAYQLPYGTTERFALPIENLIHWKWRGRHLYGRSLLHECRAEGEALIQASEDLQMATRQAAVRPRLHSMPPGVAPEYKLAYRQDHEARMQRGLALDYYLDYGQSVEIPSGSDRALEGLIDVIDHRRIRIASRLRVPPYLLGIEHGGGREISMQPAMAFIQHCGHVRQRLAHGLRQALDAYLENHGFKPPYPYRFVFPNIVANPWLAPDPDLDTEGVDDSD